RTSSQVASPPGRWRAAARCPAFTNRAFVGLSSSSATRARCPAPTKQSSLGPPPLQRSQKHRGHVVTPNIDRPHAAAVVLPVPLLPSSSRIPPVLVHSLTARRAIVSSSEPTTASLVTSPTPTEERNAASFRGASAALASACSCKR